MKNSKVNMLNSVLLLVVIFVFLLVINYNTPMIGEDFALSPTLDAKQNFSFLDSLHWIAERVYNQSMNWNARLGEQLAIVFLTFNKDIFNILNSLMTLIYGYLVFIYAFNRKFNLENKSDIFSVLLIFLLNIAYMPAFGEIFFWETGATNYLWSLVVLLIFGLPYRRMLSQDENFMSKYPKILIPYYFLSFISGMTNENTVFAFAGLVFIVFFIRIFKKQQIYRWMYISSVLYILGIVYLLTSPSTKNRTNYYNEVFGITEINLGTYLARFKNVTLSFLNTNRDILIVFLVVLFLFFVFSKINTSIKTKLHQSLPVVLFLVLLSSASVLVLIMAPYIEKRAFFLSITMIIMAITYMTVSIYNEFANTLRRYIELIIIIALIGISLLFGYKIYNIYYKFNNEAILRNAQIISASVESRVVNVEPYITKTTRLIDPREDYVKGNYQYYRYYNLNEITISPRNSDKEILYNIETKEIANNTLKIKGWAFPNNPAFPTNLFRCSLILNSDTKRYIYSASVQQRPDVTEYFHKMYAINLDNTGFLADIPVSELDNGIYKIEILLEYDNKIFMQMTEHEINITK